MRREEKNTIIESLAEQIRKSNHFYLADISDMNAAKTNQLRRKCFEKDIRLVVVKNTLLRKALEQSEVEFDPLYDILQNSTSIMFCDTGNIPAKLIKDFRTMHEKPILKAAYVEESIYIGDDKLNLLTQIKSKDELIADVIVLLQSPMKNLLSALQSGSNNLAGIIKTLAGKG